MTKRNPFPGMNPFFEQRWRDAHTALITYLRDALQERLPPDLVAIAEEEAIAVGGGGSDKVFRPDVQVRDPAAGDSSGTWALRETAPVAEPIRVFMEDEVERWVEIRGPAGRLITVIELLSPSNKLARTERERYENKRHTFVRGGVNLVEIDLVRQGDSLFAERIRETLRRADATYGICVFRASSPAEREVYPIGLREPLPAIHVPLRSTDEDVALELQPLIDQCHERGRYHSLEYGRDLAPPFSLEDAAWVEGVVRESGLL